jgi:hypothetical protein
MHCLTVEEMLEISAEKEGYSTPWVRALLSCSPLPYPSIDVLFIFLRGMSPPTSLEGDVGLLSQSTLDCPPDHVLEAMLQPVHSIV